MAWFKIDQNLPDQLFASVTLTRIVGALAIVAGVASAILTCLRV